MQELMQILLNFIDSMDDEDFRQKIQEGFFKELEPFIGLIPEDYKSEIKKTKFSKIRKLLEKEVPTKAKIIAELKRWQFLEKEFERFKKKI